MTDGFGDLAFREHLRLIMAQDGISEREARLRAWLEGPKGYVERRHKNSVGNEGEA